MRILFVSIALGVAVPATAQDVAATFGDLSRVVKEGNVVIVQDEKGERTKGKITDLSDASLRIVTGGVLGRTVTFTSDRVSRVSKVDSRLNGFLIGAAIGVAAGIYSGSLVDTLFENEAGDGNFAYPLFGALMGLTGGGIGYAIDGAIDGQRLVYRRPSLSVSIKF